MKKLCLPLFLLLISAAPALAVTPAELANQAQADYQAQHYDEAIKNWQELNEIGFVNGPLYYNIASAYWRQGKVGQARRYFTLARDWSPRDPEIRQNLGFIESKIDKPMAAEGPRALLNKIPFYRFALNAPESLVCLAVSCAGLFAGLALYRWKRHAAYAVGAVVFVFPLLFGFSQFLARRSLGLGPDPAVVLSPKLALRDNPIPDSPAKEELIEGNLVKIRKSQGDFALVKSASGKEGWVEKSSLGEIE